MLKRYVQRHPVRSQRFLEILPGFVSWSLILFPFWGSFVVPTAVAYYIIAFSVYWLYRSLSMAILSSIAHLRINASSQHDWLADANSLPDSDKIHHIIVVPTYKEPLHTLQRSLRTLAKQSYPLKRIHVMISFEEREGEPAIEKAKELEKEFGKVFGDLWTTFHPDIHGEVKGKSSNMAWGGKLAKRELVDKRGIQIEYCTITSEDADAMFHQQYFSCLTFLFLTSKKPFNRWVMVRIHHDF